MSVTLNVNNTDYFYPTQGDENWGREATDWAVAVTNGMLQKSGGLFQLLGEVSFGANFGIRSLYYKSISPNISELGVLRLSNTDSVGFRNFDNDGNLLLSVNSSNQLTFDGKVVPYTSGLTPDRAVISDSLGLITSSPTTSAEIGYLSGTTSNVQTQLDSKVINVTTTKGDLLVRGASTVERLPVGPDGYVIQSDSAEPTGVKWVNPAAAVMPPGAILPYGGTTAPAGYLLCDGSAVSRSTYADLFAIVGTSFGAGDGSTTFNVPDSRGRFMRFVDGSAGRDPNSGTRTAMNPGGATGNNVGSVQDDEFESHTHIQDSHNHTQNSHNHTQNSHNHTQNAHGHTVNAYPTSGGSSYGLIASVTAGGTVGTPITSSATATNIATTATNIATTATNIATTATNQNTGGSETRPLNFYVSAIIKT